MIGEKRAELIAALSRTAEMVGLLLDAASRRQPYYSAVRQDSLLAAWYLKTSSEA